MREKKSYGVGSIKPEKMKFRTPSPYGSNTNVQAVTFIDALSKRELEQNELAQTVKKCLFKKLIEVWSFLTLRSLLKKQVLTLH